MTYRYIYKITCTAGSFKDKFYFGQHTTRRKKDSYKGRGKLLVDYYKKYPRDYIKEIISYHNSQEELDNAEYDIIHPWLGNPMCLNICEGGKGKGFRYHTEETKQKLRGKPSWIKGKKMSEEFCKKVSESLKGRHLSKEQIQKIKEKNTGKKRTEEQKEHYRQATLGNVVSEETRKKISEANKLNHKNRIWINKDNVQKWINMSEYQKYISEGWNKGRK